MRFFARLSYNGADFSGWQIQTNAPSVQAGVERALSLALGRSVSVTGAGRTDAGVNARNYIAHFDVEDNEVKEPESLIYKINAILPKSIVVHAITRVPDDAHARFDATGRTYRYYIHTAKDPFAACSYLYTYPLDVEAMNLAAGTLPGKRDFSCFKKSGGDNLTSICNLTRAGWERTDPTHLVFTVTADRFLRNMVRAIVGTLLEIGRGRRSPEWIGTVLASKDRCMAGQSVPGEALFLEEITYPFNIL